MDLGNAQHIQTIALIIGGLLVGVTLLVGAVTQLRRDTTYGATGVGRFRRQDRPGYFRYLLWARILLGLSIIGACLLMLF